MDGSKLVFVLTNGFTQNLFKNKEKTFLAPHHLPKIQFVHPKIPFLSFDNIQWFSSNLKILSEILFITFVFDIFAFSILKQKYTMHNMHANLKIIN